MGKWPERRKVTGIRELRNIIICMPIRMERFIIDYLDFAVDYLFSVSADQDFEIHFHSSWVFSCFVKNAEKFLHYFNATLYSVTFRFNPGSSFRNYG